MRILWAHGALTVRSHSSTRAACCCLNPKPNIFCNTAGFTAMAKVATMTRMARSVCLLAAAAALLAACAGPSGSDPGSFYHCDRNGEREQRVMC